MLPESAVGEAIGVDGGQSTIRLRHSGGATGSAPGVSWGSDDTVAATADAVIAAWRDAGSPPASSVVLGLTTVPETASECERLAAAVEKVINAPTIAVCDDSVTAHIGALRGGWGVVLSVGTGVSCALRAEGSSRVRILGGHGYLLGDEGGAFWIGSRGIAAALKATEDRSGSTELSERAADVFGSLNGLPMRLHADPRAIDITAKFAPVVLDTARRGDRVAATIIEDAVAELTDLLLAAWRALGQRECIPLVLHGRLATVLSDDLRAAIDPRRFTLEIARGDALDGALHIAADPDAYQPVRVMRKVRQM